MGFFKFPYTNFHEMNLDWITEEVKKAVEEWKTVKNDYAELEEFVKNYFSNLDVTEEIGKKLEEMYENGKIAELISEYRNAVTLEMFGAVGDGETDDSLAFYNATKSGSKILLFGKTYYLEQLPIIEGCNIEGTAESVLKMGQGMELSDCLIKRVTFNENGKNLMFKNNVNVEDCVFSYASIAVEGHSEGMKNCTIKNCEFKNNTICDIYTAFTTEDVTIENCSLLSNGTSHNVRIYNGYRCKIAGNTVGNSGGGFGIVLANSAFCIVDSNIVFDTYLEAINLNNSSHITVSNNICTWAIDVGTDYGISIFGETAGCNYNHVTNNKIYNCAKAAINIERQCGYNIISGNIVQDCCRVHDGYAASETCVYIYSEDVVAGCLRNVIENNIFHYSRSHIEYTVHDSANGYQNIVRNNTAVNFVEKLDGDGDVSSGNNFRVAAE